MTFDKDECYDLLLAMDLFCEEYCPATAGESQHLDHAIKTRDRLRAWHNEARAELGNPPCYPVSTI
jgi:hypothetical protein